MRLPIAKVLETLEKFCGAHSKQPLTVRVSNPNSFLKIKDNDSLCIEISDELFYERISREIVSIVQNQRKDLKFDITDRIKLNILTDDEKAKSSFKLFNDYIAKETLATEINLVEKKASNILLDFKLDTVIEKI